MAKSLRSSKVQKNKTLKRQNTFGDVSEARERRIAERLHGVAYEKILESQHKPATADAVKQDETAMEVEAPAAAQKPVLRGLGANLNKKRREERKAKSKRGSKWKSRK